MKKITTLILTLFIGFSALGQQTYFTTPPSGSTSLTGLQYRYKAITPDSLNQLFMFWNGKYNQVYTATEANLRFAPVAGSGSYIKNQNSVLQDAYFKIKGGEINDGSGNATYLNQGNVSFSSTSGGGSISPNSVSMGTSSGSFGMGGYGFSFNGTGSGGGSLGSNAFVFGNAPNTQNFTVDFTNGLSLKNGGLISKINITDTTKTVISSTKPLQLTGTHVYTTVTPTNPTDLVRVTEINALKDSTYNINKNGYDILNKQTFRKNLNLAIGDSTYNINKNGYDILSKSTFLANIGGVSLTGSYANPSWITSLAYSKLTGTPAIPTSADYWTTNTTQSGLTGNKTTIGTINAGAFTATGNSSIGTTTPSATARLLVTKTTTVPSTGLSGNIATFAGDSARVVIQGFIGSSTNVGSKVTFSTARGTGSSPSAIQSGDGLAYLTVQPYGTGGYRSLSQQFVSVFATENPTNTANGHNLILSTTPNTTLTAVQRLSIGQDGQYIFGPNYTGTSTHKYNFRDSTTAFGVVSIQNNHAMGYSSWTGYDNSGNYKYSTGHANNGNFEYFDFGGDKFQISNNGSEKFRVTPTYLFSTLPLGLNTTTPLANIHINTNNITANGALFIGDNTNVGSLISFQARGWVGYDNNSTVIAAAVGKSIIFNTNGTTAALGSTALSILSNGRLLINTTTDNGTDRVQINGTIIGTGLKSSGFTGSKILSSSGTSLVESTTGTGVLTALGVNIGSAGAPVLFNGALGTPSSGVITNLTGTCTSCNIGGNAATTTNAAYVNASNNFTTQQNFTVAPVALFGSGGAGGSAPSAYGTSLGWKVGSSPNLTNNYTGYYQNNITTDISGVVKQITIPFRNGEMTTNAVSAPTSGGIAIFDANSNLISSTGLTNGTTATTQTAGDNSNKVATTQYVDGYLKKGSYSYGVTSETTFTVTIGATMANNTYNVQVTPTALLGRQPFNVTNKTTTTFDVVYTALPLSPGTLTLDWLVIP